MFLVLSVVATTRDVFRFKPTFNCKMLSVDHVISQSSKSRTNLFLIFSQVMTLTLSVSALYVGLIPQLLIDLCRLNHFLFTI